MRFFDSEQIRQVERAAYETGMPPLRLMENAGSAAARIIRENYSVKGKRIVIICGKGNNGGDGFVVARKLRDYGADTRIVLASDMPATPEASEMRIRARDIGIPIVSYRTEPTSVSALIKSADIIVDAIFGIGFRGAVQTPMDSLIRFICAVGRPVVSLDIPSGANADTGVVDGDCIRADITVSFISLKPAHIIWPAVSFCGRVITADIGITEEAINSIDTKLYSIDKEDIKHLFGKRKRDCHKGNFGTALSVCGAVGMSGAAQIAASAAVRCGAGIVKCAVPEGVYIPVAGYMPEYMVYPMPQTKNGGMSLAACDKIFDLSQKCTAMLIGCGLGTDAETVNLVKTLLKKTNKPVIIDADGINAVAADISILERMSAPAVLTPHPGEMARLCGVTAKEIQSDRFKYARNFARQYNVTLLLKGSNTIVACADGQTYVNLTGSPAMATAGSGDMLSGMILSFAAQGMELTDAVKSAVYFHGLAGERAAEKYSQRFVTPSDMINELAELFLNFETAG